MLVCLGSYQNCDYILLTLSPTAPMGGLRGPPSDIEEGVISDPMLPYSISLFLYLGAKRKNLDRNLKIWARYQDFKILWHWQENNGYNSLDFEDTGLKFCMQAKF